jgi:PDZ domain-containing protein
MSLFEDTNKPKSRLKRFLSWSLSLLFIGGVAFVTIAPTPYLVEQPGPVYNLYATIDGKPVITISGHKTYKTTGSFNMLTVTMQGNSYKGASWFEIGLAKLDESKKIINRTDVYPPGWDDAKLNQQSDVMMLDAQANAKAAALNLLDIPYTSYQAITLVDLQGAAGKLLKAGDKVITIQGEKVIDLAQIKRLVAETKGKRPVVLEIIRGTKEMKVSVTPKLVDNEWRMGVFVSEVPDFPFSINIQVGNVGGPSGGQMLALSIYDSLTPGSLTGGKDIAGTGTVDPAGNIGAIGGVVQKMFGTVRAGVKWFFVPASNCDEVVGNIPDELQVVKVSTLQDSLAALKVISSGGDTSKLPTCTK